MRNETKILPYSHLYSSLPIAHCWSGSVCSKESHETFYVIIKSCVWFAWHIWPPQVLFVGNIPMNQKHSLPVEPFSVHSITPFFFRLMRRKNAPYKLWRNDSSKKHMKARWDCLTTSLSLVSQLFSVYSSFYIPVPVLEILPRSTPLFSFSDKCFATRQTSISSLSAFQISKSFRFSTTLWTADSIG